MERIISFFIVALSVPFIAFASLCIILAHGIVRIYPWEGVSGILHGFVEGAKSEKETYLYYKHFFMSWNSEGWKTKRWKIFK